tara:strand:- start:91 stop:255 length:165 start_codon:yes stop_codon:yes gene_type:complete
LFAVGFYILIVFMVDSAERVGSYKFNLIHIFDNKIIQSITVSEMVLIMELNKNI